MATSIRTILAAALLVSGVAGQDASKKPKFAYPPNDSKLVFNMMDTVMVTYTAFYDTGTLYTFCEPGKGKLIYQQKAPGFTASVPILLNFTSATPCWFNIRTGVDGIDGENSATFNLIGEERSTGRKVFGPDTDPGTTSTTSSSTSSTLSTSSTSAASSSTTGTGNPPAAATTTGSSSTTATNPTPTDSPSSAPATASGGLSAGASAGIGVGAALGVLLLAALAFIFWRRRHRRQSTNAAEMDGGAPPYGSSGYGHNGGGGGYGHNGGGVGAPPAEMGRYYSGNDTPDAQKWGYVRELHAVHTPAEIASSAPGSGRTHHEMSA